MIIMIGYTLAAKFMDKYLNILHECKLNMWLALLGMDQTDWYRYYFLINSLFSVKNIFTFVLQGALFLIYITIRTFTMLNKLLSEHILMPTVI